MAIRTIMQDSETYQEILQEGLAKGQALAEAEGLERAKTRSQTLLLKQGTKRFGTPDAATEAAVNAINDLDRLDCLAVALLDVSTWTELLATE